MICAFVGTINDVTNTTIRGNGKTVSMSTMAYLHHLQGNRVYSNFYTSFSEEIIGLQGMIDKITKHDEDYSDSLLLASEMQKLLNSLGSTTNEVLFIDNFCSELRKHDVDFFYDTQRFNNVHLRLRLHTDYIFQPFKFHMDNTPCNFDRCKLPHKVYLYSYKPMKSNPILKIDATKAGKLYNTKEIIEDDLRIPKKEYSKGKKRIEVEE